MPTIKLIADSGSTKAEWCLLEGGKKKIIFTQGISPYFLNTNQIAELLARELVPNLQRKKPAELYYYGTGCMDPKNVRLVKKAIQQVFPDVYAEVTHDLMGAARALCGREKGIACILGTGANSCYFNGKRIVKNSPGLGFILGDEGSGAYLGRRVIQYYLYKTFDEDLNARFESKYGETQASILESVYKKPLPNRYLASFSLFLTENRGHYMIENIIEDGLNDFFFVHICKYRESWTKPIHFTGGVAFAYRDVIAELCKGYELQLGKIIRNPMEGLIQYHNK
jgi:N-acetylglucosamine kinase-like BadF-type ATPase